jgi:hypothetical protein
MRGESLPGPSAASIHAIYTAAGDHGHDLRAGSESLMSERCEAVAEALFPIYDETAGCERESILRRRHAGANTGIDEREPGEEARRASRNANLRVGSESDVLGKDILVLMERFGRLGPLIDGLLNSRRR